MIITEKPIHLRRELKLSPLYCNKWINVSCYSNVLDSPQCEQCMSGTYDSNITWMYSNLTSDYDLYVIQYGRVSTLVGGKPLFPAQYNKIRKTEYRWMVSALNQLF